MQRNNLIALLALLIVAGVALYFLFSEPESGPDSLQLESNYYLKDYHLKVFDSAGQLRHEMSGSLLRQRARNNQYDLEQPYFQLHTESANWQLSAELGWMDANMASARLIKNVQIKDDQEPALTADTESISVDLTQQTAVTDGEVTILQGENQLRGEQLAADFKAEKLKISTDVRGNYAP